MAPEPGFKSLWIDHAIFILSSSGVESCKGYCYWTGVKVCV